MHIAAAAASVNDHCSTPNGRRGSTLACGGSTGASQAGSCDGASECGDGGPPVVGRASTWGSGGEIRPAAAPRTPAALSRKQGSVPSIYGMGSLAEESIENGTLSACSRCMIKDGSRGRQVIRECCEADATTSRRRRACPLSCVCYCRCYRFSSRAPRGSRLCHILFCASVTIIQIRIRGGSALVAVLFEVRFQLQRAEPTEDRGRRDEG